MLIRHGNISKLQQQKIQQQIQQQQIQQQQKKSIKDTQIKIRQDIIRQKGDYCSNIIRREYNTDDYNTIDFITLTNTGYINYTLNCYKSLKNINMDTYLKAYCIGEEGISILQSNNYPCDLIDDTCSENFQFFGNGNWNDITFYKFEIIYKHLLNNKYVCFTDGDIVYENNKLFDFLLDNIEDNDLLIQSEGFHVDILCTGFIFIKVSCLLI